MHFSVKPRYSFLQKVYIKYSFSFHLKALIFLLILTVHTLSDNYLVRFFGFGLTSNRFTDLWLMTKLTNCYGQISWDIYKYKFDNECYNYLYGKPFIYLMDVLNIDYENYYWLGWIQILIFSYFLAFMYESLIKKYSFKIVIALLLSPPVFLLASLGNSDIWVIFIVYVSIRIFNKQKYIYLGFVLLCFATLIKLYTLPILILYLILIRHKGRKIVLSLIFICVVFSVFDSQNSVGSSALQRLNYNSSFGISVFGSWFSLPQVNPPFHPISPLSRWIMGFVFTAILVKACHWLHYKNKVSLPTFNNKKESKYIQFIIVSLICLTVYSVGTSFDYKLVWFIWLLVVFSEIETNELIKKRFLFLTFCSIWLSYTPLSMTKYFVGFAILQPLGDFCVGIQIAIIVVKIYFIIKMHPKVQTLYYRNIINKKFLMNFLLYNQNK